MRGAMRAHAICRTSQFVGLVCYSIIFLLRPDCCLASLPVMIGPVPIAMLNNESRTYQQYLDGRIKRRARNTRYRDFLDLIYPDL